MPKVTGKLTGSRRRKTSLSVLTVVLWAKHKNNLQQMPDYVVSVPWGIAQQVAEIHPAAFWESIGYPKNQGTHGTSAIAAPAKSFPSFMACRASVVKAVPPDFESTPSLERPLVLKCPRQKQS